MRNGDGPEYMAMDHVHGRLASLERCPIALGSMVSMQDNFNNLLSYETCEAWIRKADGGS